MSITRSVSAVGYDELVQRIYDAVDAPEGFTGVLPDLAAWVGAPSAQSIVIGKAGEVVENQHCGADPSRFEHYATHWMDKDPRMAASRARPGIVLSDTADIDREAFERSAIFNEALTLDDAIFTLFGTFPIEGDLILAQAFLRGRKDGPFEATHGDQVRALLPHMTRATRLRHLMRQMHEARDDLRLALDALPTPVAILDQTGRIVAANSSAESSLSRRGEALVRGGRLATSSPSEARELSAAIAKTSTLANSQRAEGSPKLLAKPIALSRREGAALWVLLYPLRPQSSLRSAMGAARTLAVFHDPQARVRLPPELLMQIHALTPREAALASAVAEGHSLADFAEARGCTEETARTHLKRVLEKTGTHRQADLVRVLLSSAALHWPG